MAKKIAASRKAASKAPARKTAKAVSAPKTHKPKGSPKERLAYLNKQEMAALVKRKGTPARRGPKGIPSFADDSASSKGVSRGDSSGTKGSGSTKTANGSVSNSSGGYNSGTSGSRGGGASTQSPGAGGNSGRVGGGGQGGYNSGVSGSRYGGASTQAPGMGRNSGQVGPRSPMGGQGTSFSSPQAAASYNRGPAIGIDDRTGNMGPYKGNLPNGSMVDVQGNRFNPNRPYTRADSERVRQLRSDIRDMEAREQARAETDFYRNPQEMREAAYNIGSSVNRMNQLSAQASLEPSNRLSQSAFHANVARSAASSRTPDVKVGTGQSTVGNKTSKGGYRRGGAVKPSKTFKNK